jgi:hypothetical protein
MWVAVGHLTGEQIIEKLLEFRLAEMVIRLHGVAAA